MTHPLAATMPFIPFLGFGLIAQIVLEAVGLDGLLPIVLAVGVLWAVGK